MSPAQGRATGAVEESYRLVPPVGGSLRPNSMGPAPRGRPAPVAGRRLGRGTLYTLQSRTYTSKSLVYHLGMDLDPGHDLRQEGLDITQLLGTDFVQLQVRDLVVKMHQAVAIASQFP